MKFFLSERSDDPIRGSYPMLQSILSKIKSSGRAYLDNIMSIPGFPSYFLSDEVLLSPEMIRRKKDPDYLPSDEDIFPWHFEPRLHLNRAYLCVIEALLLEFVCTDGALHADPMAAGCTRFAMNFWKDPFISICYPHFVSASKSSLRMMVLCEIFFVAAEARRNPDCNLLEWTHDDEVVPGLKTKELVGLIIFDKSLMNTPDDSLQKIYDVMADDFCTDSFCDILAQSPWKDVTPKDRLELLDLWHSWDAPASFIDKRLQSGRRFGEVIKIEILGRKSTKVLLDIHDEIKKTESDPDCTFVYDIQSCRLVNGIVDKMIRQTKPAVMSYIDIVEARYLERMQRINMKPQSFPDELIELINIYALPSQSSLKS
jgi:hypothetical protein